MTFSTHLNPAINFNLQRTCWWLHKSKAVIVAVNVRPKCSQVLHCWENEIGSSKFKWWLEKTAKINCWKWDAKLDKIGSCLSILLTCWGSMAWQITRNFFGFKWEKFIYFDIKKKIFNFIEKWIKILHRQKEFFTGKRSNREALCNAKYLSRNTLRKIISFHGK